MPKKQGHGVTYCSLGGGRLSPLSKEYSRQGGCTPPYGISLARTEMLILRPTGQRSDGDAHPPPDRPVLGRRCSSSARQASARTEMLILRPTGQCSDGDAHPPPDKPARGRRCSSSARQASYGGGRLSPLSKEYSRKGGCTPPLRFSTWLGRRWAATAHLTHKC